eukprot:CAMPEP_0179123762 /NCGR_PEP_ID=MMETSP0796-20121207/58461_1 /TAXON_ID=73915 /ORGANISM="Pyrodinium bahamense, Strain pbaha01" /LENGTH=93 /DNA_ID=CAMNT_0020822411 /DNA_START=19 /DNA_END=296 /DNA_ORIENTATION=+
MSSFSAARLLVLLRAPLRASKSSMHACCISAASRTMARCLRVSRSMNSSAVRRPPIKAWMSSSAVATGVAGFFKAAAAWALFVVRGIFSLVLL